MLHGYLKVFHISQELFSPPFPFIEWMKINEYDKTCERELKKTKNTKLKQNCPYNIYFFFLVNLPMMKFIQTKKYVTYIPFGFHYCDGTSMLFYKYKEGKRTNEHVKTLYFFLLLKCISYKIFMFCLC